MAKRRKRKISSARLSAENKQLAREANKRLGTKFNTRKKALSSYALREIKTLKYEGFITGDKAVSPKLTTIKAPKKFIRSAKDKGFEVRKGKIVVANIPDRISRFKSAIKKGNLPGVTKVGALGFEHIVFPSKGMNFADIIRRIDDGSLEAEKLPDEEFAFKVFGGHSHQMFNNMDKLRETLNRYVARQDLLRHTGKDDMADTLYENFELMRVDPVNYTIPPYERPSRAKARKQVETRMSRMNEERYVNYKKSESERKKQARANETAEQRESRLEKSRARTSRTRRYVPLIHQKKGR